MSTNDISHVPVLLQEVLSMFALNPTPHPQYFLDGTFGRGGHTRAVLQAYPSLVKAYAVDRDLAALEFARTTFTKELESQRLQLFHGSYEQFLAENQKEKVLFDFILLDLGVSSPQLDEADRGFSFYHDGPLDMRMNQKQQVTAATIINTWDEEDLIDVFKNYGEVRSPYRVIRALLHDRKIKEFTTTKQLAGLIERVEGWRQKGKHPATQFFLGLRLMVNQELENLQNSLLQMIQSLVPGGVLVVLTFHSLEDRIVKNIFKENLNLGYRINKKVIVASDEEQKSNPRSRSAKLRAFQRGTDENSFSTD